MKRALSIFFMLFCLAFHSNSQGYVRVVFDKNHLAVVSENGTARSSAEVTHLNYLSTIKNNLDNINLNISSVLLVQDIIHNSLYQVDRALRSGLTAKYIADLSMDIIQESKQMIIMAKENPALLLFAEQVAQQIKSRGIKLVTETSKFILKQGSNILMDYEKRDALLNKIVLELQVIRALTFSLQKSMYWAKINGILKTVNPYRNFINKDVSLANRIISNYKILRP